MKNSPRPLAVLAVTATAALLASCSATEPDPAPPTEAAVEPTPEVSVEPVEDEATSPEREAAGTSEGLVTAPWAHPAQNVGDELTTVQVGALSVQVNDSGRLPATQDQFYSDGTQAMTEGAPVVYMSWTVTNTSDETVMLPSSLVSIQQFANNRMVGGFDSNAGFETLGFTPYAVNEYSEEGMYPLAPGESFTEGKNFPLNDIEILDLLVSWVPTDGSSLMHDLKQEAEVSVTLS